MSATVSYYKITNDNAVIRQADLVYQQDGKQVSKGVEFEFLAHPLPGLDITAGYAYNDNRIVKTSEANKAIEGNKAQDAPEDVVNFWASYKFQNVLKDLVLELERIMWTKVICRLRILFIFHLTRFLIKLYFMSNQTGEWGLS
ncbi:TonB-dependent receptor domain-containing protein [Flavobacterium sp. MDT1-60]|uniref:TonB-dependent receptor domain-containing protein n=1 Tax=Flavobacterium sp. MDT1-60 TaxID=1979344 RepID=UPI00351AD5BC